MLSWERTPYGYHAEAAGLDLRLERLTAPSHLRGCFALWATRKDGTVRHGPAERMVDGQRRADRLVRDEIHELQRQAGERNDTWTIALGDLAMHGSIDLSLCNLAVLSVEKRRELDKIDRAEALRLLGEGA